MTEELINAAIIGAVPVAVAWLKPRIARLPRWAVPLVAILLGAAGQYMAALTGAVDVDVTTGLVLGGAGIGLREVADQVRKDVAR